MVPWRILYKPRETTQSGRPGLELLLLLAVAELVVWTDSKRVLPPLARTAEAALLIAVVVGLLITAKPTLRSLGLAPPSWTAGLGFLFAMTGCATLSIFVAGLCLQATPSWSMLPQWIAKNAPLQLGQDIVILLVVLPRMESLHGRAGWRPCLATALIFSLLHAPNGPLMALSFPAGFAWSFWFSHHRNLPAVWISHAILGATLFAALPLSTLGNLRVGISYLLR